jgi:hypothetical protein
MLTKINIITNLIDMLRFMESELELHDAIEELHAISVAPQLYPLLLPMAVPHSLLALVAHDNTDIAAAVLDLLQVSLQPRACIRLRS